MSRDDEPCGEPHDDVTSIRCEREKGHQGAHGGTTTVMWDDEGDL